MSLISSQDQAFLNKLREKTEENLTNSQFGVSELAKEMGMSRSNLYSKVKEITQKSVSRFISEIRLKKAKELLTQGNLTVSEVAYRVGFGSPTYFTKCFHDYFGLPPSEVNEYSDVEITSNNNITQQAELISAKKRIRSRISYTVIIVSILFLTSLLYFISFNKHKKEKSIAVLPLHNLTGETDNDYIVDGMHDALIGELGKIEVLRVISRTSTLRYKGSKELLSKIAQELGVNTIIEGSIIGAGDSIRVLIQLIDVFPKERHILSGDYQDEMKNVLNLQSSVVKDIAGTIHLKLSKKETQQLNKSRTVNPETYKSYLRGMYALNQGTKESFEKGINYLNEAIKRDPGDPFAYAGLALGYATMGHGQLKSKEAFLLAMNSAEKAVRLDPMLDEALTALALLNLDYAWDWEKARESLESALANNPNNAIACAHFAWYHVLFRDFEKAVYYGKKAVMLEPLSASYNAWLALLYIHIKDYDLAEEYAKKALSLKENIPYGNYALGKICILKGQYQEAIKYHEKLPSNGTYYKTMRGYAYVKAGETEKALEIWNEMEEYAKNNRVNSCYRGMIAAYLGFTDKAFELLNEAIDRKDYPIIYINTYNFTEDIRRDPRFNKLLLRMNLPARKTMIADNQSSSVN